MGRYFDEFEVGQVFKTPARTITDTDIINFAGITGDFNPVHTDDEFARAGLFKERIAHGPMLVGMSFGLLSRIDLFDGTIIALRDINWSFNAPVRIGDTVHVVAEVKQCKPGTTRTDQGYAKFELLIKNQTGETVQTGSAGVILSRKM